VTVILVGSTPLISEIAGMLRREGVSVVVLESLGLVALMLRSERVRTVVVDQDRATVDWEGSRARLRSMSPQTRIIEVAHPDARTADELAAEVIRGQLPSSNR
jgi:hypothetical protein